MSSLMPLDLIHKVDHLLTEPQLSREEIEAGCQAAIRLDCYAVVVKPHYIEFVRKVLKDTKIKVISVVGFPHGGVTTATKMFETQDLLQRGADEVQMVINIGALRDREDLTVKNDIMSVVKVARGHPIGVILETCFLTDEEKVRAAKIAESARASGIQTATDFCSPAATESDVRLLRAAQPDLPITAVGAIQTREAARALIEAGAVRIATRWTEKLAEE